MLDFLKEIIYNNISKYPMKQRKRGEKTMTKEEIRARLWKDAKYAVNSFSEHLIYETLGELRMAVDLKAVSYQEVSDIDSYLIQDHLNNGKYMREVEKQYK